MTKLLWNNLKNYKCPVCGKPLEKDTIDGFDYHLCTGKTCAFKVGVEKFDEVVTSIYNPKPIEYSIEENSIGISVVDSN